MDEANTSPSESMSTSENAPVAYYGDNSNGATAGLLGALTLAKEPYRYPEAAMIGASGICDLRHEVGEIGRFVKDAECNIRHDVKQVEADVRRDVAKESGDIRRDILAEGQENVMATKDAECRLGKDILETKHTLAKDIQRAEYEAKLGAQTTIKEVNSHSSHLAERLQDRVDHFERRTEVKFDKLEDKLCAFERRTDEKFCDTQKLVKDGFANERISNLEDKVLRQSQDLQTAQLLKAICCGCGEDGPGNSGK